MRIGQVPARRYGKAHVCASCDGTAAARPAPTSPARSSLIVGAGVGAAMASWQCGHHTPSRTRRWRWLRKYPTAKQADSVPPAKNRFCLVANPAAIDACLWWRNSMLRACGGRLQRIVPRRVPGLPALCRSLRKSCLPCPAVWRGVLPCATAVWLPPSHTESGHVRWLGSHRKPRVPCSISV